MTTTRSHVEAFHNDGFLQVKSLIDRASCQKLIARMRELTALKAPADRSKIFNTGPDSQSSDQHFLQSARKISFFFDKNIQTKPEFIKSDSFRVLNKVGHALHDLCPVYAQFSHQEKFYGLVRSLGQQKPRLVQSMFIFKQPNFGDGVPAHQDATFIYTQPQSVIGLWIALEDANEENGCLWALPGGHKGPLKERFVVQKGKPQFSAQRRVRWPAKEFIPLLAQAGDCIVLHGLLPHSSEQNRSLRTRFAYTLHFVDGVSYYPKDNWLNTGG